MNHNAKFLLEANNIKALCDKMRAPETPDASEFVLEMKLGDLSARWDRLQVHYSEVLADSNADETLKTSTQSLYEMCYEAFINCSAHIKEILHIQRSSQSLLASTALPSTSVAPVVHQANYNSNDVCIKVPPCDTEIFYGGYEEWPSFRDMFTAVYGTHPRLTPVQKLYHLRNKTKGQAGALVKNYPLQGDNFQLAWDALMAKYENKRVLVDSQLKILFDLPTSSEENSETLAKIQSTVNDCLTSLRNQNVSVDSWDPILLYLVSTKLPHESMTQWEQSLASHKELPSWTQMDNFLTNRYEIVERLASLKKGKEKANPRLSSRVDILHTNQQPVKGCKMCGAAHGLRQCAQFLELSVADRAAFVYANKCCANCLAYTHVKNDCSSKFSCLRCKKPHHTLLHLDTIQTTNSNPTQVNSASSGTQTIPPPSFELPSTSRAQANLTTHRGYTLLPTALARIEHLGENFIVRALIDQGAQKSFLAAKIQRRLRLPTQPTEVEVFGMGGKKVETARTKCTFTLGSLKNEVPLDVTATILSKLTSIQPSFALPMSSPPNTLNLELADPNCWRPGQIDLVIGSDLFPVILPNGLKKNVLGDLMAQNTIFGWILSGPIDMARSAQCSALSSSVIESQGENLNDVLRKFWEEEEVRDLPLLSAEDQFCERLFQETTYRQPDGKYVVQLPIKPEFPRTSFLGASKHIASQQFKRMEHSLKKNLPLQAEYSRVLNEYLTLDHMNEVQAKYEDIRGGKYFSYYLPHHSVIKPESTTTKVRVVFNASQKTTSSLSLNDVLCTGPALQADITSLLLNWRCYRYVFNGDIEKMYRQILVHKSDRKFQRIMYRMKPEDPIIDYEFKTVTFGVKPAPYLAIRCLHQLASDSEEAAPRAASILRSETYVDDILSGGHSLTDAQEALSQVIVALQTANFPLKKITANHPALLQHLPVEDLLEREFLRFEDASAAKMLGIRWNALSDHFSYQLKQYLPAESTTKRQILSTIAKLFDPAGWVSPIVITAKMMMQTLWLEGSDWDECVQPDILAQWEDFIRSLPQIEDIRIPRWVEFEPNAHLQIHGFCDASERAFCAALYLRVQTERKTTCHLLFSKTKVAPLKTTSLPRLELCGAVLLSKMVKSLRTQLHFAGIEVCLWTDSTIVLSWLQKPPHMWKTYVANRLAQIIDNVQNPPWKHVKSQDNPADLGTRGCTPRDLATNDLWWHGPAWLVTPPLKIGLTAYLQLISHLKADAKPRTG